MNALILIGAYLAVGGLIVWLSRYEPDDEGQVR